jgi:hypothetical protein
VNDTFRKQDIMIRTATSTPGQDENTDAAPLTKEQLDRLGAELILPAPAPRS